MCFFVAFVQKDLNLKKAQAIVRKEFADRPQELQSFIQRKSPTGSISSDAQKIIDDATDVIYGKRQRTDADSERINLIDKLRKRSRGILEIGVVAELSTELFKKGPVDLKTQVSQFFKSIGNKVHRHGFGDVILDEKGIGSSIGHGIGRAKSIAFRAIPEVIAHGRQIDFQKNWKGRGKDTYIFAAPITIGNRPCIMGVIVDKNPYNNRYYLHEVIDDEGNIIIIKKDESDNIKTESVAKASLGVSQSSFEDIIAPNMQGVKTEKIFSSPKADTEESIFDADVPMPFVLAV